MMTYETFKQTFMEHFKEFLPESCQKMELKLTSVNHINQTSDTVSLIDKETRFNVSPVLYLDQLYTYYENCGDLTITMVRAADRMVNGRKDLPALPDLRDEKMKIQIIFTLINTDRNEELLKKTPHRKFHDLSVVYRLLVAQDSDKQTLQSILIQDPVAEVLGLSEEELYAMAKENTRRLLPPRIVSMGELLHECAGNVEVPVEEEIPDVSSYVITNRIQLNGAASILYGDILEEAAAKMGTDVYVIPSSIHEMILMPDKDIDLADLECLVFNTNATEVLPQDYLSDSVYHYSRDTRTLIVVTGTTNE